MDTPPDAPPYVMTPNGGATTPPRRETTSHDHLDPDIYFSFWLNYKGGQHPAVSYLRVHFIIYQVSFLTSTSIPSSLS
jgi:hypothetical protein